jgi:hypothetical protein
LLVEKSEREFETQFVGVETSIRVKDRLLDCVVRDAFGGRCEQSEYAGGSKSQHKHDAQQGDRRPKSSFVAGLALECQRDIAAKGVHLAEFLHNAWFFAISSFHLQLQKMYFLINQPEF